jgi:4-amino-4-deoxy-L-arabinose transferase-like glycosyltransferase
MLLLALLCVALLVAPLWRVAILAGAAILAALLVSSLPLVGRGLRRDALVAVVVPAFVVVRALALGLGLAAGLIRFHRGLDDPRGDGRQDQVGPKT